MALGWRRPRAAMREAADIGEPTRLALFVVSGLIGLLNDPAEDGLPRLVVGKIAAADGFGGALSAAALWGVGIVALLVAYYLSVAGLLWLFTRPAAAKPTFATLRSAVAIGSWVSTLPSLALGLLCHALGLDVIGVVFAMGLWSAFVALCLSEATGLDARAGTGLALGAGVLAFGTLAGLFVAVSATLMRNDLDSLAERITP